jgi:hypothetical protein
MSLTVLINADILPLITQFQDGLFLDLLPYHELARGIESNVSSYFGQTFGNLPARLRSHPYLQRCSDEDEEVSAKVLGLSGPGMESRLPFHLSILDDNVSAVRRWLEIHPDWLTPACLDFAAGLGSIEMLLTLKQRKHGIMCTHFAYDWAAFHGHLHVLQWLHIHFPDIGTSEAIHLAASQGHLAVIQWMDKKRATGWSHRVMDAAAEGGHVTLVQWLHDNRTEGCSTGAMDGAATNGHLDVVQWLHKHRSEGCTQSAMDLAAENGYLNVLMWLHEHRTEGCSDAALEGAEEEGHVDIVQWLQANRTVVCM